jgi:AAA domain, putative AbiEii toxin, Type IV TA system
VTILLELSRIGEWTYRFDESLDVFDSITADARTFRPGRPPGISFDARFDAPQSMSSYRSTFVPTAYGPDPPEPGQSTTAVRFGGGRNIFMDMTDSDRSVDRLLRPPSLPKFPELASIKTMDMSFTVAGSSQEADGLWWSFGHADFLFSAAGGGVFNHTLLSYGQKRLLAFLYYLDANPRFVIADELVNGMHHDWIRACLDEIDDRQAFLTSQNPLLLDYLPLESVEQVQQTFIQCRADVVDDTTQIVWSNLTGDDAEELFTDYQVGIQHLGELLRARGLW